MAHAAEIVQYRFPNAGGFQVPAVLGIGPSRSTEVLCNRPLSSTCLANHSWTRLKLHVVCFSFCGSSVAKRCVFVWVCPSSALLPFFGEGSLLNRQQKKSDTLTLTSLLEDLGPE